MTRLSQLPLLLALALLGGCETMSLPFGSGDTDARNERGVQPPPVARELDTRVRVSGAGLSEKLDWFPDLNQPLQQLEQDFAASTNAAQRSAAQSNIAYVYDAKLFVLFQDMLDFLHPEAQKRELQEQHRWLNQRKSMTTAAFLKYDDEREARLAAGEAFIEATQARIAEIEKKRQLVVIR